MLDRCQAGPADLLRLWNGRKGLSKEEWVARVHESFFQLEDVDLWENEVCEGERL